MYELESLTQTSEHNWRFVIRKPSGRLETMTWYTKDSEDKVQQRAQRVVDRWNVHYGVTPKNMPASSHWRAIASADDRKTNLKRLKEWNSQQIAEHKAARRKGKNV